MAAPSVILTYPNDGDTGIPVGATIKIYFDYGVDEQSVKDSVALFGRDFDFTSGPDTAIWADKGTGNNPFFLASPGFKGLIPLKFDFDYYRLDYFTPLDPGVVTSQADEVTAGVGAVVSITIDPKFNPSLPADLELTLIVGGDPSNQGVGISARTVYDIVADSGNTGSGTVFVYGTWEGAGDDELNIEITEDGNIGTAEYRWWYTSGGTSSATDDCVTNRRFRSLDNGLQIRFSGSGLVTGDKWALNLSNVQRMEESYKVVFTTNDGSYTAAPESPSTPATSTPATDILPSSTGDNVLEVIEMIPANGSYNVSIHNRKIVIRFSADLDENTITNESVKLWKYPASGYYDDTFAPAELQKTIEVDGDEITIRF